MTFHFFLSYFSAFYFTLVYIYKMECGTSTLVGTEIPISRQINVANSLLYYVSHVLMLEGIISIVSISIKRNSVSKQGGHQPLVQY